MAAEEKDKADFIMIAAPILAGFGLVATAICAAGRVGSLQKPGDKSWSQTAVSDAEQLWQELQARGYIEPGESS